MRKPGFALVWKLQFENAPKQLNAVFPPALLDFYIGYKGFRSLAFFGMSSDRVIAVDVDIARIEWEKNFGAGAAAAGSLACPGGLTTAVTRPTGTAYPMLPTAGGAGRGTPAKSGVGLPHEGAVTLKPAPSAPAPPRPPLAKPRTPEFNPFAPRVQWALVLSSDGKLHSLWVSNANEPDPPVAFIPPNANPVGLISFDDTAYAATTNGCGGVEDSVWALNLENKKVSQWKAGGQSIAGSVGPAVGPDGTLYVAAGAELTALAARTLQPAGSYKADGVQFTSSPVVFEFKGKNLIAVAASDGRLHLLDAGALSKPLDRSAPSSSPEYAVGALASWQDLSGTRWVLAPAGGSIAAWKVIEKNGSPAFEAGWTSRDLVSPLTPLIINSVVFALSSGEFRSNDRQVDAAQRVKRSKNAVLYALDAATGKELWNSGNTMTAFVHSGGLAAGGSRVYVSAYDGTQYAFGFPTEH